MLVQHRTYIATDAGKAINNFKTTKPTLSPPLYGLSHK